MNRRAAVFGLVLLLLAVLWGCSPENEEFVLRESFYTGRFVRSTPGIYGDALLVVEGGEGLLDDGEIVWLEFDSPMLSAEHAASEPDWLDSGDRIEVDIRHCADSGPFRCAPVYAIRLLEDGDAGALGDEVYAALAEAGLSVVETAGQ